MSREGPRRGSDPELRASWNSAPLVCSTEVPRHRLDFLLDGNTFYVRYGFEPAAGYRAELWATGDRRPLARYGALDGDYRADAPLQGLLEWLVQVQALDALGLDEAIAAWASPLPMRLSKAGRAALSVIEVLKREAD